MQEIGVLSVGMRAADSVLPSEEAAVSSRSAGLVQEVDRKAHMGSPGEGCWHVGKCGHWAEMPAPGRVSPQQTSHNPQLVFDPHCHFPSLGLLLRPGPQGPTVSSERSHT